MPKKVWLVVEVPIIVPNDEGRVSDLVVADVHGDLDRAIFDCAAMPELGDEDYEHYGYP